MRGRISALSIVVCALTVLTNWQTVVTGVAVKHRSRRDVFQPTNERTDAGYEDLLKEDGANDHPMAPISGLFWDPQGELDQDDPEEQGVDKRVPSPYMLKYGGLGKRKHGINALRFGGLGKRLSANEIELIEDGSERRLSSGGDIKGYFEADFDPSDLRQLSMQHLGRFDQRQQRKIGKGLRYSGLGKRMSS